MGQYKTVLVTVITQFYHIACNDYHERNPNEEIIMLTQVAQIVSPSLVVYRNRWEIGKLLGQQYANRGPFNLEFISAKTK